MLMEKQFERTTLLIGEEQVQKLQSKSVIVFGVGGVGGYCVEALVRSGIENIAIVDADVVDETNLNRQIISLRSNLGLPKVEVMKKRIMDININARVTCFNMFYDKKTDNDIDLTTYDYVVDCIDSVKSKLLLINKAYEAKVPIISAMGAGNKLNPSGFIVSDISKTEYDPLAKKIRLELRKNNISHLKVVYSKEQPIKNPNSDTIGSIAYVVGSAGFLIASEVIKDLIA